jgi:hypothetical protein
MGLEAVVVKQVVNVAKDTGKLESAIGSMEDKLKEEGLKALSNTGINPADLPFDPMALVSGQIDDPSSLLTPEVICNIPPLTQSQKDKAIQSVDSILIGVNALIDNKNKIASALQTVQTPLGTLTTTASTLDGIISTVSAAVKVIKAIPIPTAFGAPAIAIPVNVLTILSDSLDQLDKLLTYGKGVTKAVPVLAGGVLNMIDTVVTKLNALDAVIQPVVTTLSFVKTLAEVGDQCPNLQQNEIDAVASALSADVMASVAATGASSSGIVNATSESQLLQALRENADPGLIYEGFRLILEYDPDNTFTFDRRRIRATRDFGADGMLYYSTADKFTTSLSTVTIYNSPKGFTAADYSYSATVEVLYSEMKYKIDNFLLGLRIGRPLNDLEIIRDGFGGTDTEGTSSNNENDPNYMPYVLNGPNIVQPSSIDDGNEVTGTLVVNEPVKVTMTTNGGAGAQTFTNTILQFQKGNKPLNAQTQREQWVSGFDVTATDPIQLSETGIWNYSMRIINNYGVNANQSNFAIETL